MRSSSESCRDWLLISKRRMKWFGYVKYEDRLNGLDVADMELG